MTLKALPYVYKITNIHTNQFYIGSRTSKLAKHYSEDLGFKYFTSSNYVKELGFENFKIDWIEEFPTKELAYDWEQMMIHVNLKDPLCLNRYCTFGKRRWSNSGKSMSKESKDKISKATKGKVLSYAHKEKLSKSMLGENNSFYGKTHTEETKNKVRQTRIDRGLNEPDRNSMYNKTHSLSARNKIKEYRTGLSMDQKTKDKISNTTKGVPKTKSKCIYCEKLCAPNLLNRWHNDNCKLKTVI